MQCAATLAASGLEPLEPYPGGKNPWRCRCLKCGAVVTPTLNNIRSGQSSGCKKCARTQVVQSKQLSDQERLTTLTAAALEPLEEYPGYKTPWRCRCLTCGTEVTPRLHGLRLGQGGCRWCGHTRTGAANRLDEMTAVARMRESGFEPSVPYPGSKRPWLSSCLVCGAVCSPRYDVIVRGKSYGCPSCAWGRIGDARRTPADQAAAVMLEHGFEPLDPYPGTALVPWRSRHLHCGRETAPTLNNVTRGKGSCRSCALYRFKTSIPAWVYLIDRPTDGVRQYGITNDPDTRLRVHRGAGFTVVLELLACVDGHLALEVEAGIRAYLRARRINPACGRRDLPTGGWTETFHASLAPNLRPSMFEPPF